MITNSFKRFFRALNEISNSGFLELAPAIVPLAPAAFFGLAIGTAVYEKLTGWPIEVRVGLSIVVGLAAATGLEAAGYMAFHVALSARGQYGDKVVALPGAYLAIGIAALWIVEDRTTAVIGTAMFLLSATVYAGRALLYEVKRRRRDETLQESETKARQQQLDDEQRQHDREMDLLEKQQKHAQSMARIANSGTGQTRSNGRSNGAQKASDWRLLSDDQKRQLVDLSTGEIRSQFGVSGATARRWRANARQLSERPGANGHG